MNKDGLISLLSTKINTSNAGLSVSELVKVLKTSKDLIFHIMMLMVTVKTKVGTNKVMSADIAMKVCVKDVERNEWFYGTPCCTIDECWTGINVHNFD